MRDPNWEPIERELKRLPPSDPDAVRRLMARVRSSGPDPATPSLWTWLTRPRLIAVSPLGGLLVSTVLAGVVVLPWILHSGDLVRAMEAARSTAEPGTLPTVSVGAPGSPQPVQFVLVANEASRVALVGDFNNWDPEATPLQRTTEDGVWSAVVPLQSGRYLYAFVVDGNQWVTDAAAPRGPESTFGSNSVILVGDGL